MDTTGSFLPKSRFRALCPSWVLLVVGLFVLAACAQSNPDERLAAAKARYAKGEITAAVLELKSLLQDHPDHGESRLLLGQLYSDMGDYRGAEKELSRALDARVDPGRVLPSLGKALVLQGEPRRVLNEISPDAAQAPEAVAGILAARGLAHLALRQSSEARASFEKALALHANQVDARLGLARVLAAEGKLDEALKEVDQALAVSRQSVDGLMLKGDLLRAGSRLEEARAAYRAIVDSQPGHVNARLALVSLAVAAGKYEEAGTHLAAVRKATPGNLMASYFEALIHFRNGKFQEARDAIAAVLKAAPNHLPSVLVGGAVEFALGSQELAQTRLRYVLDRVPGNAYARRLLIASYARSGQTHKAMELLEPALKQGTKDPALLALAGEVYMQLNDYESSQKYFQQAAALDPKNAAMRTGLGLSRLAAGDVEAATAELQSASQLDSSRHHADVLLVATHLKQREYAQALKAALALESKQPNNPMTYNLLAAAHIGKKDFAAARRSLEKALTLQPGYTPAAINLAQLDLQEGNKAAARKRFEDIIAKDRSNVQAYIALASLGARIDAKPGEILAWLETAHRESPGSIEPLMMLARFHLQAGNPTQSLEILEKAVSAAPDNADVLELAGQLQLAAGARNRAVSTFAKLVSLQPDSAVALHRLGGAQFANGDLRSAIGTLRRALQLNPRFPEAQALLAEIESRDGRPAEGLKIAETLQRQNPGAPTGWVVEGDIRARAKDFPRAAKAYEKAYSLLPSGALAVKLHAVLAQAGKSVEGERFLKEWLKRAPNDNAVHLYLAESYLKAGNFKSAIEWYEALLTRHPSHLVALNNLAWCYQQVRDPRAAQTAEKALALNPEQPAVLDTLGWILVQSGETERGMELLKKASGLAPKAPEIRYHYAQSLAKAGDLGKAKDELERLLVDHPRFPQSAEAMELLATVRKR